MHSGFFRILKVTLQIVKKHTDDLICSVIELKMKCVSPKSDSVKGSKGG